MATSSSLGVTDWLSFLASFVLVIGIIVALFYALKRLGSGDLGGRREKRIQMLEQHALGNRQRIVLIRAKDREILVGITLQQISTLAVWPADPLEQDSASPTPVESGASLHRFLQKLKPTTGARS